MMEASQPKQGATVAKLCFDERPFSDPSFNVADFVSVRVLHWCV